MIFRINNEQNSYKAVENRMDGGGGEMTLSDLKKYTRYSVVVQAYNALGHGPAAHEVVATTEEDCPSAPPQDLRCSPLNSKTIQISWNPVPDTQLHGNLKGRHCTICGASHKRVIMACNFYLI